MNIAEILQLKFPNANFFNDIGLRDQGNGIEIYMWNMGDIPEPTQKDLEQWAIELEPIKYEKVQRDLRRTEYPAIGDQLDAMMKYFALQKDLNPELLAVKNQWQAVKAKYPLVK